ncbi:MULTISPECIES: sugar ABC transporter substrate-binding protein [unclassified Bradyrhizobium]|uniref:sugar ABC transporter substrate-binding protein n=1 Tax=unclassified Bradyrhizobium TaxID=2631580 RepID=UPI00211DFA2B|nr:MULTISPECIES: sugar ABC transporter substrate-binding protein [unclassified Bradyrhizobium]MDD1532674.1 ribose ABC transporter [Bradyrhizobium sp. WBOS8]MDD1581586.1 ribose ABC transporter [Bradyrhizobium sp. WBOS4]UUO49860.1 ribose ABC transporter [Bradyrhizobium sp. WBOS04]UUO58627.1 ribose ABC transporter [Bradyrhizobium sp. WBOS08]
MRWPFILAFAATLPGFAAAVEAQPGAPGITKPVVLPPYDSNAPGCNKPADLNRVLAFAQDNERKFMQGVARGLELAAGDRGLDYRLAQAGNDASLMSRQIASLRNDKVGALVAAPVNALSLAPVLQQVIWTGAYVGTVVPPPATTILNAPQYLTGKVLADEAAAYIKARLNGRAKVVLLTHDSLQFLAPRFTAMRDTLRTVPGVTIVADISPLTVDEAGGAAMMRTILLANPDVDVVLGADTVVLGALAAMREAGKVRNDQFFGGIDGEPAAVAEIRRGGPYKTSVSLASPIFGYAMGQHAADWLDGKSIPKAMDILPKALTLQNLAQYEADVADPAAVYNEPRRRDSYLKMYGNICFDSRDQYLNFPWSSERKS